MQLIYVMRHGESTVNVQRILTCRNPEGDLTDLGREQAAKAADWLADKGITTIYHSPFHRAQQTAQIVGEKLDLPVSLDDDIAEINCGDLQGRSDDEAWKAFHAVFDRWYTRDWEAAFPGGETYREAFDRYTRALARVRPDQTVLFVTHGGITTTVVPYICVNAAALQGQRSLGNTGLIILEPYGDGRFICRAWDSTEHL